MMQYFPILHAYEGEDSKNIIVTRQEEVSSGGGVGTGDILVGSIYSEQEAILDKENIGQGVEGIGEGQENLESVEVVTLAQGEGVTIEDLANDPLWETSIKRIQILNGEKEYITPEVLAQIGCYKLGLSPIYKQDESGYIERMKQEGLWKEGLEFETQVSREVYSEVLAKIVAFQGSKITSQFLKEVPAGIIQTSDLQAYLSDGIYTLYTLGDVNYMSISDLKTIGFNVESVANVFYLTYEYLGAQVGEPEKKSKPLESTIATYNNQKVYVGNILTYSLKCGKEVLVPVRSLGEYFDLVIDGKRCNLVPNRYYHQQGVHLTPQTITNSLDQPIDVEVISLFWNGKTMFEEIVYISQLQPGESYPLKEEFYGREQKVIHMSTMVKAISRESETFTFPYKGYGQQTLSVWERYTQNENHDVGSLVEQLFPANKIIGTMKYATHGFEKGEKVEVWAAEDGEYYHLLKKGKKIAVPWNSVSIPPTPKAHKEQVPTPTLEAYFNSLNKTSQSPYYIWTDLYRQTTYVFEKQKGSWKLIKRMPTSTGLNKTPTPTGEFKVSGYVPAFGMEKGYRCKTALHLFGDYLYHSVLFDIEGKYVISGMSSLGERASHGCLRLSPEDSKWLYETMPLGTGVLIR